MVEVLEVGSISSREAILEEQHEFSASPQSNVSIWKQTLSSFCLKFDWQLIIYGPACLESATPLPPHTVVCTRQRIV